MLIAKAIENSSIICASPQHPAPSVLDPFVGQQEVHWHLPVIIVDKTEKYQLDYEFQLLFTCLSSDLDKKTGNKSGISNANSYSLACDERGIKVVCVGLTNPNLIGLEPTPLYTR